jgi:hypothetical protein
LPLFAKVLAGGTATIVATAAVTGVIGIFTRGDEGDAAFFDGLVTAGIDGRDVHFYSGRPQLSADGRYLVFESNAPNLVPDDDNNATDVFRFDRLERRMELVSGAQAGSWSGYPTMTADGRYIAYTVADGSPSYQPIRIRDMETGEVREVPTAYTPTISPDGRLLAYVVNETPGSPRPTGRIEVLDLAHNAVAWQATISGERQPLFTGGSFQFSADGRWFAFMAGAIEGADCEEVLQTIIVEREERLAPVMRVFTHDFEAGTTACIDLPAPDGEVLSSVGLPAISGDRLAVPYMRNTTQRGNVAGASLLLVDLGTGETEVLHSTDLSFCCGGPPGVSSSAVAWGPWRKTGLDVFEPFPVPVPFDVVTPQRFEAGSHKYAQPALSADGRHLAYIVRGLDRSSGSEADEIYVTTR